MWCIPKIDAICVVRMEDVLDLCAGWTDPRQRVVCADDGPTQLIGETWLPIPVEPGTPERYECEYRRNGTVNLFVSLGPHRSRRDVKLTDRRTVADFAHGMREPVDTYIDQLRNGSAWCGTTCPPTPPALRMKPARRRRHID